MPSATGYVSEENQEFIEETLVENGPYESKSEVVAAALEYFLYNKYGQS